MTIDYGGGLIFPDSWAHGPADPPEGPEEELMPQRMETDLELQHHYTYRKPGESLHIAGTEVHVNVVKDDAGRDWVHLMWTEAAPSATEESRLPETGEQTARGCPTCESPWPEPADIDFGGCPTCGAARSSHESSERG